MDTKAIFLDVDGTLVSGHMEMSTKVKEAIKKARLNGNVSNLTAFVSSMIKIKRKSKIIITNDWLDFLFCVYENY